MQNYLIYILGYFTVLLRDQKRNTVYNIEISLLWMDQFLENLTW